MERCACVPLVLFGVMCATPAHWVGGTANAGARQRDRPLQRPMRVPQNVQVTRDVVYGKGGARDLKMDVVHLKERPAKPMPVLVWIHGGGWRRGNKTGGLRRLLPFAQRGYFCATIEYRLTDEAVFPAQIHDCKCAIRYLRAKAREHHLDPHHIGVWGSSAGGHLVALLGTSGGVKELEGTGGWPDQSSRVQAVCDFCGPSDFFAMFGLKRPMDRDPSRSPEVLLLGGPIEKNKDKARQASPVTHASKDDPPFLIVHGDEDPVVPLDQAFRMYKALKKAGASPDLYIVDHVGHGIGMTPQVTQEVTAFLDKHLRRPKAPARPIP